MLTYYLDYLESFDVTQALMFISLPQTNELTSNACQSTGDKLREDDEALEDVYLEIERHAEM